MAEAQVAIKRWKELIDQYEAPSAAKARRAPSPELVQLISEARLLALDIKPRLGRYTIIHCEYCPLTNISPSMGEVGTVDNQIRKLRSLFNTAKRYERVREQPALICPGIRDPPPQDSLKLTLKQTIAH
jgi:hypothetical protein